MKAVFDKVDRGILWETLKGQDIKEEVIKRIKKIYEEMIVTVRTAKGYTETFRTQKGVRWVCAMSPLI